MSGRRRSQVRTAASTVPACLRPGEPLPGVLERVRQGGRSVLLDPGAVAGEDALGREVAEGVPRRRQPPQQHYAQPLVTDALVVGAADRLRGDERRPVVEGVLLPGLAAVGHLQELVLADGFVDGEALDGRRERPGDAGHWLRQRHRHAVALGEDVRATGVVVREDATPATSPYSPTSSSMPPASSGSTTAGSLARPVAFAGMCESTGVSE